MAHATLCNQWKVWTTANDKSCMVKGSVVHVTGPLHDINKYAQSRVKFSDVRVAGAQCAIQPYALCCEKFELLDSGAP